MIWVGVFYLFNSIELAHSEGNLKYFGVGHQIKISKLADTLYSTLKDVLVFVISEMAKDSEIDFKFQVPKHTSFVGSIVKVSVNGTTSFLACCN